MFKIVSNSKARFLCPHCDKTCSSKSEVKGHRRKKHTDAEPVNTDNSSQEKQQKTVDNDNEIQSRNFHRETESDSLDGDTII